MPIELVIDDSEFVNAEEKQENDSSEKDEKGETDDD